MNKSKKRNIKSLGIYKGDSVKVISGKYKGTISEILEVIPKKNRVVVSGVSTFKKHLKSDRKDENGKKISNIITKTRPIDRSNVMLYIDGTTVRPSFRRDKNGNTIRFSKKLNKDV